MVSAPPSAVGTPSGRARRRGAGLRAALTALVVGALLAACQGGGQGPDESVVFNGDVPVVYTQRSTALRQNPTDGTPFAAGGDLLLREAASPSAPVHNLTAHITQGRGDASDPEASFDGRKVVFALRCPVDNTARIVDNGTEVAACTGRWNLWEYTLGRPRLAEGTLRRITNSTDHDDVDPAYLPAGRGFVFASNRQAKSRLNQALGHSYQALDEYEREPVLNLHTADANGGAVQQITFNQSHDRNPVVRANGDIMFSRWEHVADRNRFAIFRTKPDGTDLFVLYGAHSPGNSYLHPRETAANGRFKGFLTSSLMPLSRTQEGGALQFIDAANYSEINTPATTSVPPQGGQSEGTPQPMNMDRGLSDYGRITTPYPLWDGTDRILLSWRPCEVTRSGQRVPCTSLTAEERARFSDDTRTLDARSADTVQDNAPAAYSVVMFDPRDSSWLVVAAPPEGFMFTDPVPLQARPEPAAAQPTVVDEALAAQNLALIEVRSVYDTDGLNRMAEQMLVAADYASHCSAGIATRSALAEPTETRSSVADLARLKDPADAAYGCTPVRFVRALRAVAPPAGSVGMRAAIGDTDFEMQQILGYAPVEPDGSFKLQVPADVPLALQVVDGQGRAFQTHTNWIQVRPGERRTCDGCHSPRRGAALNSGAVVNTFSTGISRALATQHQSGETMASLRTRLDPSALTLGAHPVFTDSWADTAQPGVTARPAISLRYRGNADPADDLVTAEPVAGVINYPTHIQPLWSRPRGPGGAWACVNCHTDTAQLDLRSRTGGSGRLVSYEELLVGDPVIGTNGQPQTRLVDGVPELVRGPALVETSSGAMNTAGQARKSRLTEILFGQSLLAGDAARSAHPAPPATAPDHAGLLNRAEKRLLVEWMDLGGQYYNDPFDAAGSVRVVQALSSTRFEAEVLPVLRNRCVACHAPGQGFQRNRFILTGNAEGDFNVTLTMIHDTCRAGDNALLARPSTVPHPAGATTQASAVLPAGSADYNALAAWILRGCP